MSPGSLTHLQTRGELHHLFSLHVPQPVHTSDTVTDGQHAASLLQIRTSVGSKNLFLQNAGHLRCAWKTKQSEMNAMQELNKSTKTTPKCPKRNMKQHLIPIFCSHGVVVCRFFAPTHAAATFLETCNCKYIGYIPIMIVLVIDTRIRACCLWALDLHAPSATTSLNLNPLTV